MLPLWFGPCPPRSVQDGRWRPRRDGRGRGRGRRGPEWRAADAVEAESLGVAASNTLTTGWWFGR